VRRVKRRLALLTEIIAPYRIPVFNALAARDDIDLHVIFLSENDPSLRQWPVYKKEIRFSYEVLPAWRRRVGKYNLLVNRGVGAALRRFRPDAVLCGGYNYLASWQAAWWAKSNKLPLLLWSESTANDHRRGRFEVEFLKFHFVRWCKAFVAAGKSSRDYLIAMGAPPERVFVAPNAVDVEFYAAIARSARQDAAAVRARHGLPSCYFLCAGRLVPEKGIFDLLAAYAKLEADERSQIGLVFAGDGAARSQLEERAAAINPGCVRFRGFVHREELAELYARAEVLVFPTHSDPWGLVVNEAMACGLPIIASELAGCVPDLVANAENGFIVPSGNVDELARAMRTLLSNPALAREMGASSALRIQAFTPEACADGFSRAVAFACNDLKMGTERSWAE
jgi:glycosyltransferase involved in cell wall biosynthesis